MIRVSASVAALLFAGAGLCSIKNYRPALPDPIEFVMVPGQAPFGVGQPLIVSGAPENGDFLYLRFDNAGTAVFGYDFWGGFGALSAPIRMEAGSPHRVSVQMPALTDLEDALAPVSSRLRIVCDGREVLSQDVRFHFRAGDQLFFGENPIGGISCTRTFDGELSRSDGRPLGGSVDGFLSFADRARGWLKSRYLVETLVLSLLLGLAVGWCVRSAKRISTAAGATGRLAIDHRWFVLPGLAALVVFAWLITDGTFRFIYPESFAQFYDYQAQSLLHGRFDVPVAALGGEAFVVDGRYYGYFGIMPALLRIPFVILGVAFGELSRTFMMFFFAAALAGAYAILLHLTSLVRGRAAIPSPGSSLLLALNLGLGSTFLFVGSRAYIYHEAILSGGAFALWAAYFSLRYVQSPRWGLAAWALVMGLCSAQSRPSVGLFALALVGAAAVVVGWTAPRLQRFRLHGPVACLSVALFLTVNLVAYFRFHTFEPAPLRFHVQYSAFPARLAKFGGKNFHLGNVRMNASAYVFSFYGRFHPRFPYITMFNRSSADFPESLYDHAEPVLAIPFSMPTLSLLAAAGVIGGALSKRALRRPIWILLIAAAPLFAVMLAAVASAHRYTADFIPALVLGAAVGLSWLDTLPFRRWIKGMLALPTAWAIAVTFTLALHYQGAEVWGVPREAVQHYQSVARWIDRVFVHHD